MDPNVMLAALRQAMVDFELAGSGENAMEAADRMSEYLEGLDQWLSKGGFLPTAWQPPTHTKRTR
jgi:hypothetical protein